MIALENERENFANLLEDCVNVKNEKFNSIKLELYNAKKHIEEKDSENVWLKRMLSELNSIPKVPLKQSESLSEKILSSKYHSTLSFKAHFVTGVVFSDCEKSYKFDLQKAVNTPLNSLSVQ